MGGKGKPTKNKNKTDKISSSNVTGSKYHGLENQGATCYLNSVLQVLFITKDFRAAVFSSASSDPNCIDGPLSTLFKTLQDKTAKTQAITKHLDIRRVNEQDDAAECFEKILSCSSPNASQIFEGQMTYRNTCSKCHTATYDDQSFWSLPLPLVGSDKQYCVMAGIKSFFEESNISGENQVYCNQCNAKADATIWFCRWILDQQNGSNMSTESNNDKRYDPRDTTLKFVNRPDDLDPLPPEEGDRNLRAEMSCGHAVTPESLTGWCRSLLDQGQYKFKCPALKEGTLQQCGTVWSYQEVRRLAVLSAEEMHDFEQKMARLAAAQFCDCKSCPGCKTYVEREDLANLSVQCTVCTADKKKVYEFCWQCLKQWKGKAPRSDRCDNDGCINQDLELLRTCKTTALPQVEGVTDCPSIRACPTCGQKVEHDKTGCKNIICPRCQVEFCFVCLKLTPECMKTSSYFIPCSGGMAPRQTSIPVWNRN